MRGRYLYGPHITVSVRDQDLPTGARFATGDISLHLGCDEGETSEAGGGLPLGTLDFRGQGQRLAAVGVDGTGAEQEG